MYQTFTGTGRRARQVNLSGRQVNPFASSQSAAGPKAAVTSAQQDRASRQQQRERQQASTTIQRVWRGHRDRRKTFGVWREVWDSVEEASAGRDGTFKNEEESLRQFNRLMLFFSPKQDTRRLAWYGMRQVATEASTTPRGEPWNGTYLRLAQACTAALGVQEQADRETIGTLLQVLGFAARRTSLKTADAVKYYKALTSLKNAPQGPLESALMAPLQTSDEAYVGLAVLLATPLDGTILSLLQCTVDGQTLAKALARLPEHKEANVRSRLWLLGNLLFLSRQANSPYTIPTVSKLLGSLADDVDFEAKPIAMDNIPFDEQILAGAVMRLPLNVYLHTEITNLINQDAIRNLLIRDHTASTPSQNAQTLAGYALTLLRCFPRKADDIRMWLYLGPTDQSEDIPATQYFWDAARSTSVFQNIWKSSRNVINLIKNPSPTSREQEDWTVIMVFLELYTFLLKIMDDEEFMGSNAYGTRNSVIPIEEVLELVTFLKNFGFVLYFNAAELEKDGGETDKSLSTASLSRHFGATSTVETIIPEPPRPVTLAGMRSLTIDHVKGLVTGLLRAIYERDSRRHFLPSDHWLMTSRFDMGAFIPGVVAEEESRHMVQEQDDGDKGEESSEDEDGMLGLTPRRGTTSRQSAIRAQQARERAQRKASRKRFLESVAPRLEILQNMPFFIPFTTRVEIFRQFVELDQRKRRNNQTDPDMWRQSLMFQAPNGMSPQDILARHHARIRRKHEFRDSFEQFFPLGAALKEPIQITFVDTWNNPEAGIDGGGVTKEFLTSVINEAFSPAYQTEDGPYFVENDKHLLYPNPTSIDNLCARLKDMGLGRDDAVVRGSVRQSLQDFEFLGRIIGKCLYEGILVDVSFAGFFLKKWALTGGSNSAPMESGYRANINDLRELDESLYRGLLALKNAPAHQVEDFGLSFTVDEFIGPEGNKRLTEKELIKNGANVSVTAENRLIYINNMSRYRLQMQSLSQTNAFLKGLSTIIQPSWLAMFNQSELQTLISGAAAEIDVEDLRKHTLYGGTYVIGLDGEEHDSVKMFWKVMADLPDAERRKVLKFVTSTPRGPLLGFEALNPKFSIRDSGADETRLPSTSTCVNLLKLPMYKSEGVLRMKLLQAVNSGAGFDLS